METWRILVNCPKHLSGYLAAEVRALGLPVDEEMPTGVFTRGGWPEVMRLNLHLRTGLRVLVELGEGPAEHPDHFYEQAVRLPWENWILPDGYLSVDGAIDTPAVNHSGFARQRVKDAVVDRVREVHGRRPDTGPEHKGAAVFLFWRGAHWTVYLDTSGEPLSRRGYRKIPGAAPLREDLAAAIVLATGYTGAQPFLNPMCGSGTLAIEAALLATRRAPGLTRPYFGFQHLVGYPAAQWKALVAEARAAILPKAAAPIVASDWDPAAIAATRTNAKLAGVLELLELHTCAFGDTPVPAAPGVAVLNPEYGARLGELDELAQTYGWIGNWFKQCLPGWRGHVLTGNAELAKAIGLRPSRRTPFYNSTIECRLLAYDLYAGSRTVGGPAATPPPPTPVTRPPSR